MKTLRKGKLTVFTAAALALLLAFTLASCGARSGSSKLAADGYFGGESYTSYPAMTMAPSADKTDDVNGVVEYAAEKALTSMEADITAGRKIIKTVNMTLESKEFEAACDAIKSSALAIGGYIESSNIGGNSWIYYGYDNYGNSRQASRNAYFTIRVPADKVHVFTGQMEKSYNVTSFNTGTNDITDTYYDIEARLDSLRIQEERLLEMLKKSEDLEYLLKLEDKLSEIRYNIESITSQLNRYDALVAYSTVTVNLNEVIEYTITEDPVTFGERMSDAVSEGWKNFTEWLGDMTVGVTYALPSLIFVIILAAVIVWLATIPARRRRRERRNAAKLAVAEEAKKDETPKA